MDLLFYLYVVKMCYICCANLKLEFIWVTRNTCIEKNRPTYINTCMPPPPHSSDPGGRMLVPDLYGKGVPFQRSLPWNSFKRGNL
jgi:hypothetical protein